jgi:benzoate-CoA ligase family protein
MIPGAPISLPEMLNAAEYFVDRNLQAGRGENIAIECENVRLTYRELHDQVNRVGNGLRKLGLGLEERVLLLLQDTPEFAVSFFAAIKVGAVPVPVNTLLNSADYQYLLNDSRARVAIVSEPVYPQLQSIPSDQLRYLKHIVLVGPEAVSPEIGFTHLVEQNSSQLAPEPTSKDDVAFWLYSSGSTGRPKACVHLQHDMVVCAERYAKGILGITSQDRCFSVAKLFFAYGLGNGLYFPLAVGATTVLWPGPPKPQHVFECIERHRPTLFFSVPSNFAALLAYQRGQLRDFDLSSIRHAISAGEALPAPIFHRFKQRFGVEILDAIGSTEVLHMFIANRPNSVRVGSSGQIVPGYEAKIVDDHNQAVEQGHPGNLLIKADSTCAFYWNQHEKTKDTIEGHWIRTGDKYYQDADGYFWYAGRSDDMLKCSGVWVSPIEIESALIEHPAVQEAAVVGKKDADELLKPIACVVLKDGLSGSAALVCELEEFLVNRLPAFKRPRWIEFFPELPKTATGKIQRFKLRQQLSS